MIPSKLQLRNFMCYRDDLPVLFASGYTRDVIMQDGRALPGARLLHKPYSIDSLAAAVRDAIDAAAARRAAPH